MLSASMQGTLVFHHLIVGAQSGMQVSIDDLRDCRKPPGPQPVHAAADSCDAMLSCQPLPQEFDQRLIHI